MAHGSLHVGTPLQPNVFFYSNNAKSMHFSHENAYILQPGGGNDVKMHTLCNPGGGNDVKMHTFCNPGGGNYVKMHTFLSPGDQTTLNSDKNGPRLFARGYPSAAKRLFL